MPISAGVGVTTFMGISRFISSSCHMMCYDVLRYRVCRSEVRRALNRPNRECPRSSAYGERVLSHAGDDACPIPRLYTENSGVTSGALTESKTFRLRASLREGGCRFLHLDGEERSITLHEQIDFLLIVVAEEVERRSLSGVGEALVGLPENMGLEKTVSSWRRLQELVGWSNL